MGMMECYKIAHGILSCAAAIADLQNLNTFISKIASKEFYIWEGFFFFSFFHFLMEQKPQKQLSKAGISSTLILILTESHFVLF